MNWNSHRIEEAISDCYKVSKAVAETQASVKGHEARLEAILSGWGSKLIVERKTGQVQIWFAIQIILLKCEGKNKQRLNPHFEPKKIISPSQLFSYKAGQN